MVCFYYKDILNDIFPEYFMKAGFKIVTAGNIYDINFYRDLNLSFNYLTLQLQIMWEPIRDIVYT